MTENRENTLTAYLGPEFQQRLIWQLLVEPEFAEKIIPDLAIEYFDDPNLKRLFIIMLEYYKEFDKVPNLQNQSIHQAINTYKTPNNLIEEESLFAVIKRIELWNERIINKQMLYDGDVVQKSTTAFIKQQEYRKIAEHIQDKVKNGDIKSKYTITAIEEKFQKISHIGEEDDDCESLIEGIEKALRKEYRETIPTGIGAIDELTDGGLGKGEIGLILAPSGVGKTTALTIIANTAYEQEKNVAHIVFEDTKDEIKRKHYVIWAESALSKLGEDDEHDRVLAIANAKAKSLEGKGRLLVKRFSQEDTTMKDVRNWMLGYEKKWGFKFDILVIDYLDCLESHKKTPNRNEAELTIVKGFEALAADFNIPAWTAIQSNRSGIGAEFVEAYQTGGSIKRMQKAHFFMSIAKTPAQQEANFANIRIIKARFAKDGQMFEDCVFNNDTMEIIIDDPRYRSTRNYKNLKHHDKADVDRVGKKAEELSSSQGKLNAVISQHGESVLIDKLNSDEINKRLRKNAVPEKEIKNEGAIEGAVEGTKDNTVTEEIMEIDGKVTTASSDDAVSDAVSDGVSDAVSDGVNTEEKFEWTGETVTNIVTEPEEIPVPEEKKSVDLTQFKPPGTFVVEPPPDIKEVKFHADEMDEVMKKIQETDPDAPQGENKSLSDMLVKKRNYQYVKPKD